MEEFWLTSENNRKTFSSSNGKVKRQINSYKFREPLIYLSENDILFTMKKIIFSILSLLVLISCSTGNKVEIVVSNSLDMERTNEMIEISHDSILSKLGLSANAQFVITDVSSNEIPYQIAVNPASETEKLLIFPVTVNAGKSAIYTVKKGNPAKIEPGVYGRLVPERKDDFTWENDKIAFRVYGPALEATGEISSGIDVWAKRTDQLIVDKWYADELAGKSSYHTDNGEGLDYYKVGPTLGAGASAPFINDSLWYSKNFTDYDVLDNGPLRITVKFNYSPYVADQVQVTPSRIISLDKGSQMNKVWARYESDATELPVAAGLIMRQAADEATHTDADKYFATYKEPTDSLNGTIYTGIVGVKPFTSIELKNKHILGTQTIQAGESYEYYAGAGWSKGGFETYDDWNKYVSDFTAKLRNPLKVEIR